MRKVMLDVALFHQATDTPLLLQPTIPAKARSNLRVALIQEECDELIEAIGRRDLVEIADACADLIYVVAGTAHEYGIPLEEVWDEVQRSNMAKVDPTTGKVRRREDDKILKPEGWTPPDIATILFK